MKKSHNLMKLATVFTVCIIFTSVDCQSPTLTVSDSNSNNQQANQQSTVNTQQQQPQTQTQIPTPTYSQPSTTPNPVPESTTYKRPSHTLMGTHLQSPQQEPVSFYTSSFRAASKNPNAKHIVYQGYPRRIYLNDKANSTHPYQVLTNAPQEDNPSSYVQIEIYKVVLYNQSIVERMDRVHDSYCNLTQTEETLARMDECIPKYKESWIVKCQAKVYGNNWTYTDKRNMICNNRAEFQRKWRRCIFDDFDSLLKTRNEERLLYKIMRSEEPTFGTPSSIFKQFESIREKRLKLLECEEKVLGISQQQE